MRGGLRHAAIRLMSSAPAPSSRIGSTDVPCIVQMQQMLRGKTDVLSLAQGIVHWSPPPAALEAAVSCVTEPATSLYGADDGLPELRTSLKAKLAAENGLTQSEIMITAGANQAYTNLVLALLDAGKLWDACNWNVKASKVPDDGEDGIDTTSDEARDHAAPVAVP